ncbi:MAG: response regulator [Isosphaeraceae bacterium]
MGSRILIADDDPEIRFLYATVLRGEGYEVLEAIDGTEVLDCVSAHQPDLVLLDIWMPSLNGFEVLDRLLQEPSSALTRVVILSNLSDADAHFEGFSSGVVDYWVKGLSLDDLRERVRRVLAGTASVPGVD